MPASRRDQRLTAERREKLIQLRAAGATFQTCADQLGYKTAGAAVQDHTRAMRARAGQLAAQADVLVAAEVERYDAMDRAASIILGRAINDPVLALRAIDRLRFNSAARRQLLGLDKAPASRGQEPAGDAAGDDVIDQLTARRIARRQRARAAR